MQLPTFQEEQKLWKNDFEYIIGVDEVGRGCFAGPVTAAAVIFEKHSVFEKGVLTKINDSKLLNANIRKILAEKIKNKSLYHAISSVDVLTINKFGIGKSTQMAVRNCIKKILEQIDKSEKLFLLIDGYRIKHIKTIGLKNQKGIIKGDRKSISIAAASIIAKVHRDSLMIKFDKAYPQYNFYKNKGYGTKFHQKTISKYGLSELHRTSFNLQKFLQ